MIKNTSFLLILSLVIIWSNGCSSHGSGWGKSYVVKEYPAGAEVVVAEEMATAVTSIYPPGHTAVSVIMAKKDEAMGEALENALRSRGFVIVTVTDETPLPGNTLQISYVLDRLDETTWYSRLALSSGTVVTRTWVSTWASVGETLVPEGATRIDGLVVTNPQKEKSEAVNTPDKKGGTNNVR